MDQLAALLDGPRARGAFLLRCILDAPWSLRIQDEAPLAVTALVRGQAWLVPDKGEPTWLRPGEIAIMRGPEPYTICDAPGTSVQIVIHPGQRCTTLDGRSLYQAMDLGVRTWGNNPDGDTVLLTGAYSMEGEISRRLLEALPPLIVQPGGPIIALLGTEIVRTELPARERGEAVAECLEPVAPDGEPRGHVVAAVALEQVAAGEQRGVEIEARDAAAGALPHVAVEGNEKGGPAIPLDDPRRDDPHHARVPTVAGEHEPGVALRVERLVDLRERLLEHAVIERLALDVERLEPARQRQRFLHLRVVELQIERQPIAREQRIPSPPARIDHQMRVVDERLHGVTMVVQALANAAHVRKFAMRLEHGLHVVRRQIGEPYDAVWIAVLVCDALQPSRFGNRIVMVVLDLQMHGLHHILVLDVGQEVFDQIVLPNGGVIAEHAVEHRPLQPRIVSRLQVVKVMMRIDNGQAIHDDVSKAARKRTEPPRVDAGGVRLERINNCRPKADKRA